MFTALTTRRRARASLLALLASAALATPAANTPRFELWFYESLNLADSAQVEAAEARWRRAARAGYGSVVVADPKFARLATQPASYFAHAERLKATARACGLHIIPGVFIVGRAQGALLAMDPNLAEALPVRDARFVVRDGLAQIAPDPDVALARPPDRQDWGVRIESGVTVLRDPRRAARVEWRTAVSPQRAYHVSLDVRTQAFTGEPQVRVRANGREIAFARLGVEATQGWTRHHVVFVTPDARDVTIAIGVFRAAHGTLAWRDARIEETGPVNLVRRSGAPIALRDAATGVALVEGRDFDAWQDSLLGVSPWRGQFGTWHAPPALRVRRPDGTRLRVSWHQAAVVYKQQVAACLSDSGTMARLADEAARVRALFGTRRYLLMHDEIRALNQDAACRARGLEPGAILADHLRQCRALLPGAEAAIWSDMVDPTHNATRDYVLVRGDLAGAWNGLARDAIIVNWNHHRLPESLRFFARRGHRQIVAGYYDGADDGVAGWRRQAEQTPGVIGAMYTTWQGRWESLEAFANEVRSLTPR